MAFTDTITAPTVRWSRRATRMVVAAVLVALIAVAATQLLGLGGSSAVEPATRSVDYALRHPDAVVDLSTSQVDARHDYGTRHLQPADAADTAKVKRYGPPGR